MDDAASTLPGFLPLDDVEPGRWLHARVAENFGEPNTFIPRGFGAYARILHPLERDRPRPPETWATVLAGGNLDFEYEMVSWAQTAAVQGKHVEKYSQGSEIAPPESADPHRPWLDASGWRYGQSVEGNLDVNTLARVAGVLAKHTNTPGQGVAAIWEGWGSGTPARYTTRQPSFLGSTLHHLADRARSLAQNLLRPVATLELPGRSHRLYAVGALDLVDPAWPARAPWVEHDLDPHSPSVLWPTDHAWVLATDVDYDSTIVAGTRELVDELLATPGIECFEVGSDIEERLRVEADEYPG